jgi:hypothetical protein
VLLLVLLYGHITMHGPMNVKMYILYLINYVNPLNTKLNPICHLLALLEAQPILHVSRISVNMLLLEEVKLLFMFRCVCCVFFTTSQIIGFLPDSFLAFLSNGVAISFNNIFQC